MSLGQTPEGQKGKAPILECVREGFAFLGRDWRQIAPVALIGAAFMTPPEVWAETAVRASDLGTAGLCMIAGAILQVPVLAAYYRRAVSRGTAPLKLQVGRDELNLAGVTLSVGFLFTIVALAGFIVMAFVTAALFAGAKIDAEALQRLPPAEQVQQVAAALGTDGQLSILAVFSLIVAVLLWFSARLALAYAATIAEGKAMIFSTWSWTKGNALAITACVVLTVLLPTMLLTIIAPAAPGGPMHWVTTFITAAAALFFVQAPYAALTAYLYRGLRPPA